MIKKLLFISGFLAVATFGAIQLTANAASVDRTRDCDKYAIVYCGTMSVSELRSKYNDKDHDIVFKAFGISKSEISGDIRKGVVHQDGRVTVGSKTVATGATMGARHLGGSSISGSSTARRVSVSKMGSAQEALVKFDKNGKFEWAVMTPCGNPVNAKAKHVEPKPEPKPKPKPQPKPVYACDNLTATPIASSRDQFAFKTEYTAKNGATAYNFLYDFGDGNTKSVNSATITHTYTSPGTYTAKVTFQVKVDGKVRNASGDCTVKITVKPENCPLPGKEHLPKDHPDCKEKPPVEKKPEIEIEKTVNSVEHVVVDLNQEFTYNITVTNTGEVELKDAVVTDPAPEGVTFISASAGTITDNKWTYTIPSLGVDESKDFTITAKVPNEVGGTIKNTVCVDTPTIPGGPDDCDDATVEVKVVVPPTPEPETPEPEEPETPEELPETGIASVASGVAGIGSLTAAGYYYISSRRSF